MISVNLLIVLLATVIIPLHSVSEAPVVSTAASKLGPVAVKRFQSPAKELPSPDEKPNADATPWGSMVKRKLKTPTPIPAASSPAEPSSPWGPTALRQSSPVRRTPELTQEPVQPISPNFGVNLRPWKVDEQQKVSADASTKSEDQNQQTPASPFGVRLVSNRKQWPAESSQNQNKNSEASASPFGSRRTFANRAAPAPKAEPEPEPKSEPEAPTRAAALAQRFGSVGISQSTIEKRKSFERPKSMKLNSFDEFPALIPVEVPPRPQPVQQTPEWAAPKLNNVSRDSIKRPETTPVKPEWVGHRLTPVSREGMKKPEGPATPVDWKSMLQTTNINLTYAEAVKEPLVTARNEEYGRAMAAEAQDHYMEDKFGGRKCVWKYTGCKPIVDINLPDEPVAFEGPMSSIGCTKACRQQNKTVAAIGHQLSFNVVSTPKCYCMDQSVKKVFSKPTCTGQCPGNKYEKCGSPLSVTTFECITDKWDATPVCDGWQKDALCINTTLGVENQFKDDIGLLKGYFIGTTTGEQCRRRCNEAGFRHAGWQRTMDDTSSQCYCGSFLQFQPSELISTQSKCSDTAKYLLYNCIDNGGMATALNRNIKAGY